jgi:hypothetical protein
MRNARLFWVDALRGAIRDLSDESLERMEDEFTKSPGATFLLEIVSTETGELRCTTSLILPDTLPKSR